MIQRALATSLALAILACQSQDKRTSTSQPADSAPAASVPADTRATPSATPNRAEDDGYVGERLKGQFGAAPSMAWVVPPHRLIVERRLATPRTLGSRGVEAWTFEDTIPAARAKQVRREQHVACDSDGPLYAYSGEGPSLEYAERVLLIDSSGVDIRSALVIVPSESSWLADAVEKLAGNRHDLAHRDTSANAAPGDEFYSFHGGYDTSAIADAENETHGVKYLVRRGVLLHAPSGTVIASDLSDVPPVECDGCGTPTLTDDFATVFPVLQVLRLPGFPHPVLLLNTSTVEGRALSLTTFDEAGVYRSYRVYEYVVNCF